MSRPAITVHLIGADGRRHTLQAATGRSLMRAAVDADVEGIAADCGGSLSCATCHVIVEEIWCSRLPPVAGDERAMLEMTACPAEAGSRLSCQITLTPELDGLEARLPPTQY